MQLIEYINDLNFLQGLTQFKHPTNNKINKIITQFPMTISPFINNTNQISQFIQFNCILHKISHINLHAKIKIKPKSTIHLELYFFYSHLFIKPPNHTHKSTLINYFLKLNQQTPFHNFIIDSLTGHFKIKFQQKYPEQYFLKNELITQFIFQIVQKNVILLQNHIKNCFKFLIPSSQSKKNIQLSKQKYKATQLKGFIKVSSGYAWKMLKSSTQGKKLLPYKQNKKHQLYLDARKEFLDGIKQKNISENSKRIYKIYTTQKFQNEQIVLPTIQQQKDFQNTYLSTIGLNRSNKLINWISLTKDSLEYLIYNKEAIVQCHEWGKLNLAIKRQTNINAAKYEREILSKFQNVDYMGLPRYYFIKNFEKETQCYTITNMTKVISFKQYLEKNYQTISIITKLHILHQISLALKYFRDNSIIYHKLIPQNIQIKKGLFIKIIDFTNSFHNQVNALQYQNFHTPLQSFLPYVSNYQISSNSSYGDQKADSYSFGNILFEILYGKTPFYMKYGQKYSKFDDQTFINKALIFPPLICLEKQSYYGDQSYKFLTFLSLKCIHHQRITTYSNSKSQKQILTNQNRKIINVKQRPYLDWIVAIIRSILENQKRKIL